MEQFNFFSGCIYILRKQVNSTCAFAKNMSILLRVSFQGFSLFENSSFLPKYIFAGGKFFPSVDHRNNPAQAQWPPVTSRCLHPLSHIRLFSLCSDCRPYGFCTKNINIKLIKNTPIPK